jgi:hypothetical protein
MDKQYFLKQIPSKFKYNFNSLVWEIVNPPIVSPLNLKKESVVYVGLLT